MRNAVIEHHDGKDGHGQGQHQLEENLHVVRAVDARSLVQFAGNAGLEVVLHDEHVPAADCAGQDQRPHGVHQPQISDHQERGDQATGEQHGKGEQESDELACFEIAAGEGIGGHRGQDDVDGRAQQGVENGVFIAGQDLLIVEYALIGDGGQSLGQQVNLALYHQQGAGEGAADGIDQRIGNH